MSGGLLRRLVVVVALAMVVAGAPGASAGDLAASASDPAAVAAAAGLQAVEPPGQVDDGDPIDVSDPQPPSPGTRDEREPAPSGRVRSGPHSADVRDIETNNLEPIAGVVPGSSKVVEIPLKANEAAFAGTPLKVVVDKTGFAKNDRPQARIEVNDGFAPPEGALTSLFRVNLEDADGRAFAHEKPLKLKLDFSKHASTLQGNLAGRLELVYYDGCHQVEHLADEETQTFESVTVCDVVRPLETTRDDASKTLTATLDPDAVVGGLAKGEVVRQLNSGSGWYGYGSGAGDSTGTYVATPFANVADYQVSLFTGAFATSYPIAVPPSPAGPAPSVSLSYSSAAVDGMRSDKNNQPGPIGTGWSLGAGGSITRHFNTSCTNGTNPILDACPLDDEYSLTLNGVGSRLIYKSTSGGVKEFRLESDPMWRIEMKTDGSVARESHGEYWVVTTPDGTQYEFGNTNDSLDHVPVYTFNQPGPSCQGLEDDAWRASHVCYKAWRWNLDKVTDTFGNEMVFDYRQELDYYGVRTYTEDKGEVIRASHVARIRYAKVAGTYRAQVLFDYEIRCKEPTGAANCDENSDLVDTPVDLACRYSYASCDNAYPSYFSELNLDSIRTQVYESGDWNTVAWYDLDQSFPQNNGPTSTEVESPAKLWLNSVTQRPGSDSGRTAFTQLEAEDYDAKSSISIVKTSDWGAGRHAQGTHDGDWIKFNRVDFGNKAYKVLARYSSDGQSGNISVFLDDFDDDPVATIPITDTGSWNTYDTVPVNGLNISGIHDVYFRFDNPGSSTKLVNLNWVRFKASASQLDGLNPTVFEPAEDASGYYHKNRAENLSGLLNVGRPPIRLPRVGKLTTTLQGQVDVTYGQDHGWDSEAGVCHQNAGNLHSGPECDYFDTWYDGVPVQFNIWKVKKVEAYDAFSENATNTVAYAYSRPGWRWTETPGYSDTSCASRPCNTYADFRGHEKVTVTRGTAASGTDGIEEHLFFQGLNGSPNYSGTKTITRTNGTSKNDDNWLAGRQTETRTFDEATWANRTVTDYYSDDTISGSNEAYFVAPSQVVSYTNQSGSNPRLTATYGYDAYGNVTREIYNSSYDSSADRNVNRVFLYNTSKWILGSPKKETLWEGLTTGSANSADEKSFARFYYQSGTTAYSNTGPPDTGAVKRVRAYAKREGSDVYSNTSYTYDSVGRVTHVTDPLSRVVETHYHSATGFADWVDNAKDHRTALETDAAYGAPTKITDPNGKVTEVAYDDYGRTTDVWLPTEPKTSGVASLEFDYTLATASSHAMTESRQLVERSSDVYLESYDFYDGFGRVVQSQSLSETSGYRNVSSRYFSERGALRREAVVHRESGTPGSGYYDEDWTGSSTSMSLQTVYTVNDLDQVTLTETIADDSAPNAMFTESMDYDGFKQTATDRNGVDTGYVYDVFGSLASVTEHDGTSSYTTGYDYDVANRLTTVHNSQESGHGDDITITYDLLGRKTAMVDPDMGNWSYVYDKAGNLTSQNDGRSEVVVFTYDSLNRPLVQYDTSTSGDKIAQWAYDNTGEKGFLNNSKSYENNVLRVTVDPLGFDARGRVTSTKWTVAGQGAGNWTVSQTYDPADRIETLTYPTGETVTYEYSDRTGRPASLTTNEGDAIVAAATYSPQGAPVTQTWGQGTQDIFAAWDYKDDSQRLYKITADTATSGGIGLALFRYDYDPVGNITQLKDNKNSSQEQCFTYDDLGRLKTAFTSNDDSGADDCSDGYDALGAGPYHRSYEYSPLGNITSWTNELTSTTNDYTYAQTGNAGPHAVTNLTGVGSYTYDANGNQTARPGGDTLDFDVANRLASYTSGGNTTTFTYDADGARVVRDEGATESVYVGGIYEEAGTNNKSYYAFNGAVVAYREQDTSVDERYYLITDHLGTNSHQIKYSDSSRSSQYYYPFGEDRASSGGGLGTDRGYTGQVSDAAQTGLLFYNARYYDPALRRFISADTIIPDPGNPQDLNRYTYVRNNPINFADPSGHDPDESYLCQGVAYECTKNVKSSWAAFLLDQWAAMEAESAPPSSWPEANKPWWVKLIGESRAKAFVTNNSSMIESASADAGIDPDLLRTVLAQEGGYEAVGLGGFLSRSGLRSSHGVASMQVGTAMRLHRHVFGGEISAADARDRLINDDEYGVTLAAHYLSELSAQVGGTSIEENEFRAFMAYSMSPDSLRTFNDAGWDAGALWRSGDLTTVLEQRAAYYGYWASEVAE